MAAEKDKEPQAEPLTAEEFREAFDRLVKRARAAGVRPLEVLAKTYLQQGVAMLDSMLAPLEKGTKKAVKKRKKAP